ncbi:MAG: hypothetical protein QXJ52_05880, partial [Candidatus Korarchaeota archaeon]
LPPESEGARGLKSGEGNLHPFDKRAGWDLNPPTDGDISRKTLFFLFSTIILLFIFIFIRK